MSAISINRERENQQQDRNPFEQRLNDLRSLKQGWFDGVQGETPSLHVTHNARIFLAALHEALPSAVPAVSPVVDGGLSVSLKGVTLELFEEGIAVLAARGVAAQHDFNREFDKLLAKFQEEASKS